VTDNAEIFRHLRPQFFDRRLGQLVPASSGGVSFLLRPTDTKRYDYWIYICPKDVTFSAKQSVKSLRSIFDRGVVPWGTIELDGSPIINQLVDSISASAHGIPSEVNTFILSIVSFNQYSAKKRDEYAINAARAGSELRQQLHK